MAGRVDTASNSNKFRWLRSFLAVSAPRTTSITKPGELRAGTYGPTQLSGGGCCEPAERPPGGTLPKSDAGQLNAERILCLLSVRLGSPVTLQWRLHPAIADG